MRDSGKLHALEAVLVGALFFSSAGFVLTFDMPSTPDEQASDELQNRGEDALDTFYDKPLDDPRYGDNLMSKRLAQSISGDTSGISNRLNDTLPRDTLYNLYLSNGFATQPIYESFRPNENDPTTSTSRLIEPKWSYVFSETAFEKYPQDPTTTPTKLGLYTLPVSTGTSIRTGGAEVDVVVNGDQDNGLMDSPSGFRIDTSFTVRQASDGSIPHASLYFNDSSDDPTAYRDITGHGCSTGTCTTWYNLTLEETAGVALKSGTQVNVTFPRAWKAWGQGGAGYSVLEDKTENGTRGDVSFELDSDLSNDHVNLEFNATYTQDEYEFYTFQANLGGPNYGDAHIVVRPESMSGYTGGDIPYPRVSAPRSMGTHETGTWVLGVPNPQNQVGDGPLNITNVTVEQPEGEGLFGSVNALSGASSCSGTWSKAADNRLVWTPSGSCEVSTGDALELAFEVESSASHETDLTLNDRFHPPASFDNGYDTDVDGVFTDALPRHFVPPDTTSFVGTGYDGYPASAGSTGTIDTTSTYKTNVLKGNATYDTKDVDTYQTALALGSLDVREPRVAIGETAKADIEVESLLFALSEQGLEADVETNIYPPWAVGESDPVHTVDHVEQNIQDLGLEWVFTQDLDDDGQEDIVAITQDTKAYGFEGSSGNKMLGYQLSWEGDTASAATEFELNSTHTAYAVGFESGVTRVFDEDFDVVFTADISSGSTSTREVQGLTGDHDWDGDGQTDLVAGSEGNAYWINASNGASRTVATSGGGPTRVQGADLIDPSAGDAETVVSVGKSAAVSTNGHHIGTEGIYYDQHKDKLEESIDDGDLVSALKDPTVYRKPAVLNGYNTSLAFLNSANTGKSPIWKSSSTSGAKELTVGDLSGDGVDDAVSANATIQVGDFKRDSGRIQAFNGSRSVAKTTNTIVYGSTILDMATPTRSHAAYVTKDGVLEFTHDAWTTRHYYVEDVSGKQAPINQFRGARAIAFPNATHGWIAGEDSALWRTTDANINWERMNGYTIVDSLGVSLDPDDYEILYADLSMNESAYGVVVGGDCVSALDACSAPWIAYTSDGGERWDEADVSTGILSGFRLTDVHFPTDDTGYAVGHRGAIVKSTDSGKSWDRLTVDHWTTDVNLLDVRPDLHAVHFTDASTGVVAGEDGTILRTTDGGSSWSNATTLIPGNYDLEPNLHDLSFATDKKGYAVGEDGAFFVTNDGGERWVIDAPMVPSDMAGEVEYRTVETPTENIGYAGGTENEGGDRLWTIFQSYDSEAVAVTETLSGIDSWHDSNGDGLADVRSATIEPIAHNRPDTNITYYVSNDGCSTWVEVPKKDPGELDYHGSVDYEWVDFPDQDKHDLCVKAEFETSPTIEKYDHSPWLYNFTLHYEYKESGDSSWSTRGTTYELDDASVRDDDATTADWNVTEGTIAIPTVDDLWVQRVHGAVRGIATADLDPNDDHVDVLAWTGHNATTQYTPPDGDDNRVYAFDGETGELLRSTSELEGPPRSLHVMGLPDTTGDSVDDFVVGYRNETGVSKARAYDGSDFSVIWTVETNATAVAWTDGQYDGDAATELARGTTADSATMQPVLTSSEPDGTTPAWEWTVEPEFLGAYTMNYEVPRHALFGPYVVETSVQWDPGVIPGTQTARLFDFFSVTPPDGEIPESPIYRLELVSLYEGST